MEKFKIGTVAWIVENNSCVCQVTIKGFKGGFYIVVKAGTKSAIRLRESRIYPTEEEARCTIKRPGKTPYDLF